jgi:hypothetical protein
MRIKMAMNKNHLNPGVPNDTEKRYQCIKPFPVPFTDRGSTFILVKSGTGWGT